jgi:alpha-L-arabinofuranosidase
MYVIAGTDLIGNNQWLRDMLADNVSRKDHVEIHDYIYFPDSYHGLNFTDAQYYDMLNRSNESQIRPRLDGLVSILDQYDGGSTGNRVRIWEGEWGCWMQDRGDGWQQWGTLMEGLSAGEHLNLFIRYSRRMFGAGLAQAINVIQSLFNTESTEGRMVKTPTFYVFKMYIPHHVNGARYAPITLTSENATGQSIRAVSAAATVNNSSNIFVSLTNIDLTANRTVNITLTNTTLDPTIAYGQVVTGPAKNSYNNYGVAEVVTLQSFSNYSKTGTRTYSVTLPARSIVMLAMNPPIVTATKPGTSIRRSQDAFSIRAGSHGTVLVTSSVSRTTPVTISLYGVDGRTLIQRVSRTFQTGEQASVFEGGPLSNGIRIVRITGEGVSISKRIVVAK